MDDRSRSGLEGKRALSSPDLVKKFPLILGEVHPDVRSEPTPHVVDESLNLGFLAIEHGLLAMDMRMSVLHRIINMSEGRDKIFKLLSSSCKALRWLVLHKFGSIFPCWFSDTGFNQLVVERLTNLQRSTSLTRKFLKLGLAENFFRLFVKVYLREPMGWRKILALGRLAGMTVYFFWNYPVWACKVGLLKRSHKAYAIRGLKGYLLSAACQTALDTVLLYRNIKLSRSLSDYEKEVGLSSDPDSVIQERLSALASKRLKHQINLFKNFCDILGAANGVWRFGLNDLHVGVLGMISSAIGCGLLYARLLREKELERSDRISKGLQKKKKRKTSSRQEDSPNPRTLAGQRAVSMRDFRGPQRKDKHQQQRKDEHPMRIGLPPRSPNAGPR